MSGHTGEGEASQIDTPAVIDRMAKRHKDLLALSAFGLAYPEAADLIRSIQRQVTADHALMLGLHERLLAMETDRETRENDGR